MKRIFYFFFSILLVVFSFSSCYYDKEDLLYGSNGPCTDTLGTASYSQKVVPMFTQYCYTCHTGAFPSGGILMGTYASDKVLAQNGKLYGSVSHAAGFSGMPKGMAALSKCQQALIKKWIDTGMLNN